MKTVDLTRVIAPDMPVFPGDGAPVFRAAGEYERDGFRETALTLTTHTGTHIDAPAHVIPGGATLDRLPVSRFCGRAAVLDCEGPGAGGLVTMETVRRCPAAEEAEFILIRTGWEKLWGRAEYFGDYPVLDEAAARWLTATRKKGVGLDVMSLDPIRDATLNLHHIVLGGGVLVIENLCNLARLPGGLFTFCAFPLNIADADGSPVRAVAVLDGE